ncbi:MAG: Rne/Rng family ribonuclease [Candidatus Eisenbacteria bacterium]|uniref:Rne/Rng family ribonuclease n=1 Tax=Eiseniibacteriota bacterium TaxID=2212470 RepID=A0A9D6QP62_UNCEI|nr:Rne/Rng family ribonuclease [Candidatus Eisenbacteria bacterium]
MKQTIIINADAYETRIAILEDGELAELLVERAEQRRHVGDIYKGRVNAVLPGMQAAFVDLGLPKTGFLHASDLSESLNDLEDISDLDENGDRGHRRRGPALKIEDHLKKGQEVLVQITKESIGTKGPRVTQQVSLPGRYCVLMPGVDHVGVSRRIEDRAERQRIKAIIADLKPKGVGLIARTAGEGKGDHEFAADVKHLVKLWQKVDRKAAGVRAPAPVHRELEMTAGLIRDLFTDEVDEVVIDDKDSFAEIQSYLKSVSPELRDRVKLYPGHDPIFDAYAIEPQIEKTFERKVWLKKGGYICIDHTEALVAIDVNTGRFTGKKNQEETIFRTNLEAAREVQQARRARRAAQRAAQGPRAHQGVRGERSGSGRDDAPARTIQPAPLLHRGLPALRGARQGALARDHAGQARARDAARGGTGQREAHHRARGARSGAVLRRAGGAPLRRAGEAFQAAGGSQGRSAAQARPDARLHREEARADQAGGRDGAGHVGRAAPGRATSPSPCGN